VTQALVPNSDAAARLESIIRDVFIKILLCIKSADCRIGPQRPNFPQSRDR